MALSRRRLINILAYDPATGVFTWRERVDKPVAWNKRWAGKRAGTVLSGDYRSIRIDDKLYRADQLAFLYVLNRTIPAKAIHHTSGRNDDDRWEHLAIMPAHKLAALRPVKLDGCLSEVSKVMHPRRKPKVDKTGPT